MNIPLNINWQQILLHLFNFAILGGGLYFLLYKPVKGFMEKRTAHFQEMEDAAQKKVQEADELKAKYSACLQNADKEITENRVIAQQSIDMNTKKQLAAAEQQSAEIIAEAKATADRIHDKAVQDVQKELQELAVDATKKLILKSDTDLFDQFLNAADREANEHVEG